MVSFSMLVHLVGSLGLFIYGMKQMSEGLQKVAGRKLRRFLAVLTSNKIMGVLVGTGVTSIIQSSSATTVMVVGFVNAGLMTLLQAIGVIMGANIGTTVTAQLVSFELGDYAFHAIALGGFTYLFASRKKVQYFVQILLGFGLLFLGLNNMSASMSPLRDSQYFIDMMENFSHFPILGVLTGLIVTVAVQSSSASFGILVGLVSAGVIDYQSGIPILLGSNIGTTVTAVLSSIGANLSAKRSAAAHVIFNVLGSGFVIFLLYLIPDFSVKVQNLLEYISGLMGFGPGMDAKRLLANTHTLFNVTNTLIWLPFVGFMATIVRKLLPGEDQRIKRGLVYLDERMLETPSVALEQCHNELIRMHGIAREMLEDARPAFINKDMDKIKSVRHKEEIINEIETELVHFLTRMPHNALSDEDNITLDMYFALIDDIENMGDDADNIAELAEYKIDNNIEFSRFAIDEVEQMFDSVFELMDKSLELIKTEDFEKYTPELCEGEQYLDQLQLKYRNEHMKRLNEGTCDPGAGVVFLEVLEDLEHVSDQFADIAQTYVEKEEEL
ncbi:MAG: Na/Pi cotransporter family protein [Bacillota bacterium]